MKRLAILLFALALPCAATATDYTLRPELSQLSYGGVYQGAPFDGHFNQWTAAISYDPANLASSKFDVNVTLASVKTKDNDQNSALPGADFFNVAKFPVAHYVTTGFHKEGNLVIADGQLRLRGVTKPVSLKVVFTSKGPNASLDVAGKVKRLDFGVGVGDYADTSVIGPEVTITAHLQLTAK